MRSILKTSAPLRISCAEFFFFNPTTFLYQKKRPARMHPTPTLWCGIIQEEQKNLASDDGGARRFRSDQLSRYKKKSRNRKASGETLLSSYLLHKKRRKNNQTINKNCNWAGPIDGGDGQACSGALIATRLSFGDAAGQQHLRDDCFLPPPPWRHKEEEKLKIGKVGGWENVGPYRRMFPVDEWPDFPDEIRHQEVVGRMEEELAAVGARGTGEEQQVRIETEEIPGERRRRHQRIVVVVNDQEGHGDVVRVTRRIRNRRAGDPLMDPMTLRLPDGTHGHGSLDERAGPEFAQVRDEQRSGPAESDQGQRRVRMKKAEVLNHLAQVLAGGRPFAAHYDGTVALSFRPEANQSINKK